jgi:DNA-directed RNA polymerase delta subunit
MIDSHLISLLSTSIGSLTYSARTRHSLERYGIKTVADIACLQENEIASIKGVGPKIMAEIRIVTQKYFRQIFDRYSEADVNKAIKLAQSINYRHAPASRDASLIQISIEDSVELLPLSRRAKNSLFRGGVGTVKDLIETSEDDILRIRNVGEKTMLEIRPIRKQLRSLLYTNADSSTRFIFDLPGSIDPKLISIGINQIDDLTQYTSEELVLNAHLDYLELLQVQHYLSSNGLSLSTRWPARPLVSESSYQYLLRIGAPLEEINISRLALPGMLKEKLLRLGIETVNSLSCQSKVVLLSAIGFASNELIDILENNLKIYFEWLPAQSDWDNEIANQSISPLYFLRLNEMSLEELIDNLLSSIPHERYRRIMRLRYGLDGGNRRTLRQIGDRLNITRERVRQLEKYSLGKLANAKHQGVIRAIYQSIGDEIRSSGGIMSVAQIGAHMEELMEIGEVNLFAAITLLLSLEPNQFVEIQPNKRWGLIDTPIDLIGPASQELVKILKKYHAPLSFQDLEKQLYKTQWYSEVQNKELLSINFLRACLSTDDSFEETDDDQWALARWKKSRMDELVMALRKLGQPSHFTDIARVANELLPPSQKISDRNCLARMQHWSSLFVWVDRGTYGLAEWGLKRVRFYVDIAEELLEQIGEPLSFEEIFPVINAEREASPESIMFMLGTNPRFCSYPDNKYGLAIWLEDSDDISERDGYGDPFLEDLKQRLFDSE